MATVVDRQRAESIPAQDSTGSMEAAPQDVAIEGIAVCRALQRADERIVALGALSISIVTPLGQLSQRRRVPPERNASRSVQFGLVSTNQQMGAPDIDAHVTQTKSTHLTGP
jgi:hypothetical protein